MQTQKVFQAGNSSVVTIPKNLMQDVGIKKGQRVFLDKTPDSESIIIRKSSKTMGTTVLTPEFKEWLDKFIEKYRPVLKKLSHL